MRSHQFLKKEVDALFVWFKFLFFVLMFSDFFWGEG